MKRTVLFGLILVGFSAAGGLVVAETGSPAGKVPPAAAAAAPVHEHDHTAAKAPSDGTMCGKMMGGGMGPMMMGGSMGPMMMGDGTKVNVKNFDKGVTMTFTADDTATVGRLQKMAEAMRLMHEAMAGER